MKNLTVKNITDSPKDLHIGWERPTLATGVIRHYIVYIQTDENCGKIVFNCEKCNDDAPDLCEASTTLFPFDIKRNAYDFFSICHQTQDSDFTDLVLDFVKFIQDQDQDSLLVKRRNDNHSPGPLIRELVPSSHQRSELSNTILCIFSG